MRNKRHWHVVIEQLRDAPHARGAEVGVFKGIFANRLLRNLSGIQTYYCIDPWAHYEDYFKMLRSNSGELKVPPNQAYKVFLKNISQWQQKIIILRGMSVDMLPKVADNSLDFVFIDGNHTYEYAKPDIIGWSKKVKVGGLIAGHDYKDSAPHIRKIPFGVGKAVRELIPEFQVEANTWYTTKRNDT